MIEKPCRSCGGQGRVRREKTLSVNIPPGVEDGTRIRLAGEGEVGVRGAAPGDLYIFVSVAPHAIFQRDGANIHCRVPISITTAALGGTIEVPTVEGSRTKVTVPAGTQSGHQFRLRGKGMTVLRSPLRGDMYVEAVRRDAGQPDQAPAGIAARIREGRRQRQAPTRKAKASSPGSRNSSRICGSRFKYRIVISDAKTSGAESIMGSG